MIVVIIDVYIHLKKKKKKGSMFEGSTETLHMCAVLIT